MIDCDNPMSKAHAAPRCTAKSKRTGERCRGPAVKGWRVCQFHGAGGGHPAGPAHPSWRHGMRAREWLEVRRELTELAREARAVQGQLTFSRLVRLKPTRPKP